jgi:putative pyruvate formate lyase activating enzyme
MRYEPSYISLFHTGALEKIADTLESRMKECTLCPHSCHVDRTAGKSGFCRSGMLPVVSSFNAHFGEEPPLVGTHGSGTIFFTNCNMACIFCQNYDISHLGNGEVVTYEELAFMMVSLQNHGCHNINFVTPTHMVYAIVRALLSAVPAGLRVPLVYNSGGYDSVETVKLLEGVFDIYMPDFKYWDPDIAQRLSGIRSYPEQARNALREMHRQVGDLKIDNTGVAYRGLIVRHLVLPEDLAGTKRVIDFLSVLSRDTFVNVMDQYRPVYRAREHPCLGRRVTLQEIDEVLEYAEKSGLRRVTY